MRIPLIDIARRTPPVSSSRKSSRRKKWKDELLIEILTSRVRDPRGNRLEPEASQPPSIHRKKLDLKITELEQYIHLGAQA